MAYEIGGRNEADYRWLRFEAPTELLDELNHNLKIADGVLRFRIFKVDADSPVMVPPAVAAPAPGASRDRGPQGPPRPAAAAETDEGAAESADVPVAAESADAPAAPAE
jgi:small subunit ribosomal protein S6